MRTLAFFSESGDRVRGTLKPGGMLRATLTGRGRTASPLRWAIRPGKQILRIFRVSGRRLRLALRPGGKAAEAGPGAR